MDDAVRTLHMNVHVYCLYTCTHQINTAQLVLLFGHVWDLGDPLLLTLFYGLMIQNLHPSDKLTRLVVSPPSSSLSSTLLIPTMSI